MNLARIYPEKEVAYHRLDCDNDGDYKKPRFIPSVRKGAEQWISNKRPGVD